MDEERTTDAGMGEEGQTPKPSETGGSYQPGQGGTQDTDPGIQPGRGDSQGNDWNKEPDTGTPEGES